MTFSIGQEGATDLAYARMVADHLKTTHHEVHVTQEQMLEAIPSVIRDLETWDTTTVRAATGHTLLASYIRDHTSVKVLFSGEGADEIMGSYCTLARPHLQTRFRRSRFASAEISTDLTC